MRWKMCFLSIGLLVAVTACSQAGHHHALGFVEGQFIYLGSSVPGNLLDLAVSRGNEVKANAYLYRLDPNPESALLEQAKSKLKEAQETLQNLLVGERQTILSGLEAELGRAKADLVFAEQTLKRDEALYKTHAISRHTLDDAVADYKAKFQIVKKTEANLAEAKLGARQNLIEAQRAQVSSVQAQVNQYTWQLSQKTGAAPAAGQIFDTFYKVGEYIPAGNAVLALLTPSNVKLIFYISEKSLSQLKINQTVKFNCDGCQTAEARVNFISPQAEYTPPVIYSRESREKLVYRIEATLPENIAMQYHPGQPVEVSF